MAFVALTLVSCGPKVIETNKVEVERQRLNLESPAPVKLDRVKWIVITPDNADEVFAELRAKGYDVVLFGVNDEDYKGLAVNFGKIQQFLILNKAVLDKYREYYEPNE